MDIGNIISGVILTLVAGWMLFGAFSIGEATVFEECATYGVYQKDGVTYECKWGDNQ